MRLLIRWLRRYETPSGARRTIDQSNGPLPVMNSESYRQVVSENRVAARIDECRSEADQLRDEFEQWLAYTAKQDAFGQYRTQLGSLAHVIRPALQTTRQRFLDSCAGISAGEVYDECRRTDQRVILLRRLWRWYADRFDQRLDTDRPGRPREPGFATGLRAADEMVWSCWSDTWRAAGLGPLPGPAPLPYVDTTYSAVATPRSEVPADLRQPRDELLRSYTERMPIPTIALPPIVTRRPWWLIVVAHEVGHHVQSELLDDAHRSPGLSAAAAAAGAGAGVDEQERWRLWTREIFADAFAFVLTGSATVWAVEELERRTDGQLGVSASPGYPPPLVRWALLRVLGERCGVSEIPVPASPVGAATPRGVQGPLERIPVVVDALLDAPVSATTLRAIAASTQDWQYLAANWRRSLLERVDPIPVHTTEAARLCVAGGVLAWRRLTATPDWPAIATEGLADRLRRTAAHCRAEGLRAARAADGGALSRLTRDLIDDLFANRGDA